jgi:very-short-patch-repair endonuclease
MRALARPCSACRPEVLAARAVQLRGQPTASEAYLWNALRGRALGAEIRRQVPVGKYILDFLVPDVRLAIEIDGPCHDRRRHADERRDAALRQAGYRVLRVEAEDVLQRLPVVLARIVAEMQALRGGP